MALNFVAKSDEAFEDLLKQVREGNTPFIVFVSNPDGSGMNILTNMYTIDVAKVLRITADEIVKGYN